MRTLLVLLTTLLITQTQATNITFSPNRNIVICGATTVYFVYNKEIIPDLIYWDFGDGSKSTLINPEHQYSKPGVYDVKLVVIKNNVRDSLVKKGMITIKSTPEVGFTQKMITETHTELGIDFRFINTSNHFADKFSVVKWTIAKDTLSGDTVIYTFKKDGEYRVTLMVENNVGCSAEETAQISINNAGGEFPTGIHNELTNSFVIYPNPATRQCNIEFNGSNNKVSVLNGLGILQSVPIEMVSKDRWLLDVSTLVDGVYIIQCVSDDKITNKALVVSH